MPRPCSHNCFRFSFFPRLLLPVLMAGGVFLLLNGVFPSSLHAAALSYSPKEVLEFADELYRRYEYDLARLEYERFLDRFPHHPWTWEARMGKARCLFWSGSVENALQVFQRIAQQCPEERLRYEAALMAARCYVLLDQKTVATTVLLRLIRQDRIPPLTQRARFDVAWLHFKEGDWKEGREILRGIPPESPYAGASRLLLRASAQGENLPAVSPTAAGILSGILPGAGQLYLGLPKDAGFALLLNGIFIATTYEAVEHDLVILAGFLALVEAGFYGGNIYNAVNQAHKINRRRRNAFLESLWGKTRVGLKMPSEEERWMGILLRIPF